MDQTLLTTLSGWLTSRRDSTSRCHHYHDSIVKLLCRVWKEMSLDNTITEFERSKLAVWDYPVSDKYTKVATNLQNTVNIPSQSFRVPGLGLINTLFTTFAPSIVPMMARKPVFLIVRSPAVNCGRYLPSNLSEVNVKGKVGS